VENMIDDFNKRQRVIDLGEEAEDEILESTGKTDSIFDTPQYRRVMKACKERSEIPTMAWTPDLIDFTQDSEYRRLYEGESNEKTMATKGRDTCSTKESRQNSERNRC